jgi:hypothetical protein
MKSFLHEYLMALLLTPIIISIYMKREWRRAFD